MENRKEQGMVQEDCRGLRQVTGVWQTTRLRRQGASLGKDGSQRLSQVLTPSTGKRHDPSFVTQTPCQRQDGEQNEGETGGESMGERQ